MFRTARSPRPCVRLRRSALLASSLSPLLSACSLLISTDEMEQEAPVAGGGAGVNTSSVGGAQAGVQQAGAQAGVQQAGAQAGVQQAGAQAGVQQAGSQAGVQQAGSQAGVQQAGSQAGVQQAGSQAGSQAGAGGQAGVESPWATLDPTRPPSGPITSLLSPHLPEESCVAHDGSECLMWLIQDDDASCAEWRALRDPPSPVVRTGDQTTCAEGSPHPNDLARASDVVSYARRATGAPPLTLSSDARLDSCALAHYVKVREGAWDPSARCFTPERDEAYATPYNGVHISLSGPWTALDTVERMLGLTYFSAPEPFQIRHLLLSSRVTGGAVGLSDLASCTGLTTGGRAGALPFSFFPGVGHIPFERVSAGNHAGQQPYWSVEFTGAPIVNFTVEMSYISSRQTPVNMTPIVSDPVVNGASTIISWDVGAPLRAERVYQVRLSWRQSGIARAVDLFMAFEDCGYAEPLTCDPVADECLSPNNTCGGREAGGVLSWRCLPYGPLPLGAPCANLPTPCGDGALCVTSASLPEGKCSQVCNPTAGAPNACADVCAGAHEVLSSNSNIGACL